MVAHHNYDNLEVLNVIKFFDKIGGFDNFNATLFSELPLPDRIGILEEEYKKRPSTKTVDRLILALAKMGDEKRTKKYIYDGIAKELLDEYAIQSDHYTSWLQKGPSKLNTNESALQYLNDAQESHEFDKEQIGVLVEYLQRKYTSTTKDNSGQFPVKSKDDEAKIRQENIIRLAESFIEDNKKRAIDYKKSEEREVSKNLESLSDQNSLFSEIDKRARWYISIFDFTQGAPDKIGESREIQEYRIYTLLDKIEKNDQSLTHKCMQVRNALNGLIKFRNDHPHPDNHALKLRLTGYLTDEEHSLFKKSSDRHFAVERYERMESSYQKKFLDSIQQLIGKSGDGSGIFLLLIVVIVLFILFTL